MFSSKGLVTGVSSPVHDDQVVVTRPPVGSNHSVQSPQALLHSESATKEQYDNSGRPNEAQYITVTQSPPATDNAQLTPLALQMRGLSDVRLRQRKMDKLRRTLGESVPPELVFKNNVDRETEKNGRWKSADDSEITEAPRVIWKTPANQGDKSTSPSPSSMRRLDQLSTDEPTTSQPLSVATDETPLTSPAGPGPHTVISVSHAEYEGVKQTKEGQQFIKNPATPTILIFDFYPTRPDPPPTIPPVEPTEEFRKRGTVHRRHSRGISEQMAIADPIPKSQLITRSASLRDRPRRSDGLTSPVRSHTAFSAYTADGQLLSLPVSKLSAIANPIPKSQLITRSASLMDRPRRSDGLTSPVRSHTAFSAYTADGQLLSPPVSKLSGVQREERKDGWSGEWNQNDMQDVIRKLRDLK